METTWTSSSKVVPAYHKPRFCKHSQNTSGITQGLEGNLPGPDACFNPTVRSSHLPPSDQEAILKAIDTYNIQRGYSLPRDWQQKTGYQNEFSPHTCHLPRWRLPITPLARWRLDLTVTPTDRPELCSQLVNHTFSSAQYLVGLDTAHPLPAMSMEVRVPTHTLGPIAI